MLNCDTKTAQPAPRAIRVHRARLIDTGTGPEEAVRLLHVINDSMCSFRPAKPDRPLVLYGAGNLGRLARDHLLTVGLIPAMVVDRNAEALAQEPDWAGIPIVTPESVPQSVKRDCVLVVSVATSPYVPLEAALTAQGWAQIVPFYDLAESFRQQHPLSNGWFADRLDGEELASTSTVLERWDDDISRAHHLQFLAWRRLREEWTFANASLPHCTRFFIPEITGNLGHTETFLDLGAHHGSVTEAFIAQTAGQFHRIVAVEPDSENRARFLKAVQALDVGMAEKIEILQVAIDRQDGLRRFHHGLGYASQFASTGQSLVTTTSLDNFCAQRALAPGFIKLHLEGGELDALKGGLSTLGNHRPVIAATVYHNEDGIWRTPLFLMEALDDYRFIMRLHGWCGTGAVLYGIPKERKSKT